MSSRKRISAALAGLILLVLIGWLAREHAVTGQDHPHAAAPVAAVAHPVVDVHG